MACKQLSAKVRQCSWPNPPRRFRSSRPDNMDQLWVGKPTRPKYAYIHYIALHCITLHYVIWHYIALHCITSPDMIITIHYNTLQYITIHYNTLQYITLHYITLHYILLHYVCVTSGYITSNSITLRYTHTYTSSCSCNCVSSCSCSCSSNCSCSSSCSVVVVSWPCSL